MLRFSLVLVMLLLQGGALLAQGTYRNQRIFVVPCPGPVVIDGALNDWDLSGEIYTFVSEATAEVQSARTALMYDNQALYVSARIADPSPMMNRNDPAVNPDFGWNADAFQLRLCTDPTLGYPLKIGNYDRAPSESLLHMTLWYYTDSQQPVLHIKYGMDYHDAPEYPKGIVQRDKFQGAYRTTKNGYVLEYRIPWTTLRAQAPLKANDLTAGALQIQWSDPEGKRSIGSGWAVDLLRHAGFSYQSTSPWGKVIFAAQGNLPREITQEGLPPVRNLPLKFAFELEKECVVSVAVVNEQGDVVRHILAGEQRPGGKVVESWDGLDDAGRVLPAGKYTWKMVNHEPFTTKYVLSVGNSGTPGYHTPNGKGAWGGDWGNPVDICFAGDKGLICWSGAEAGPGIIMMDAEGNKQWGGRYPATQIATDGEWLYAFLASGSGHASELRAYAVKDGQQLNFQRGELFAEPNTEKGMQCSGLAYANGKLYLANALANDITEYQARQGKILRRLTVPAVTWLTTLNADTLLAISNGQVLKVSLADGQATPFIIDHLDEPQGMAIGPDGTIYVSNAGALHNVSLYASSGKYLRSIGIAGGRALAKDLRTTVEYGNHSIARRGKWNPAEMLNPRGLAVDSKGHLWVTENDFSPKRVSRWDTRTGKFLGEKLGACYVSTPVTMDPADPTRVYANNIEYRVNLDKGTWEPQAIMFDSRQDAPYFWPHMVNNIVFTAKNGKQYMHSGPNHGGGQRGHFLFIRRGRHFEGVAGIIHPQALLSWREGLAKDDPLMGWLLWVDLNGNGIIETAEVKPTTLRAQNAHSVVDHDLNFYTTGMYNDLYWQRISPAKIDKKGVPLYDESTVLHVQYAKEAPLYTHDLAVNPADGAVMMFAGADIKHMNRLEVWPLTYWTKDGQRVWRYRQGSRWYDAYEFSIPKPGQLWGATKSIGITDGLTGFSSYHGLVHLMTVDGVMLGTIMKDGRSGETGADHIQCEWFTGQLVKTKARRWYLLGGDQDGRVLQVFGLDSLQRSSGTLTINDAETSMAAAALAEWSAQKARAQSLVIARVQGVPDWMNIRGVNITVDEKRGFTAQAAYDATDLHLRFEVQTPFHLVNNIMERPLIFKGGNCLDLQLATDAKVDPQRTTPAPGDIRVLVTRQAGKPLAVVYRHKVATFTGPPTVFTSPTGKESIDVIEVWEDVKLSYEKTPAGFTAVVTLPLAKLGWTPTPGTMARLDVGYLFGNETGNNIAVRKYWSNDSFTAGVTNDVPHESRIEPGKWGLATVE